MYILSQSVAFMQMNAKTVPMNDCGNLVNEREKNLGKKKKKHHQQHRGLSSDSEGDAPVCLEVAVCISKSVLSAGQVYS